MLLTSQTVPSYGSRVGTEVYTPLRILGSLH